MLVRLPNVHILSNQVSEPRVSSHYIGQTMEMQTLETVPAHTRHWRIQTEASAHRNGPHGSTRTILKALHTVLWKVPRSRAKGETTNVVPSRGDFQVAYCNDDHIGNSITWSRSWKPVRKGSRPKLWLQICLPLTYRHQCPPCHLGSPKCSLYHIWPLQSPQ